MEAGLTLKEVEDIVFSNTRTLEFFNSADYKQVCAPAVVCIHFSFLFLSARLSVAFAINIHLHKRTSFFASSASCLAVRHRTQGYK